MSWTDRVWSWLGGRADAAPSLPGPALPVADRRHDSVYNPLSGIGDPGWDKSVTGRPNPYHQPLSDEEIVAAYSYSGLSQRVVNLLPSRATRKGWTVPDIGVSEDRRLQSWGQVCTGAQMGNLLAGAIGLMVTEDDVPRRFRSDPYQWAEQPLDLARVGKLHAIQIFDAYEARPAEWERDLRSTGYRLPRIWSVSGEGFRGRVHASRVLYFRGTPRIPSRIRGGWFAGNGLPDDSVLQALWNEIARLETTMQAGAHLAQELREAVMKIADLPQKQVGDEADAFSVRMTLMARFKSMFGINLIGPNDAYENRSTPPTGFKELSAGAQEMLCTVLGWPRCMLTGEAPGGLSTDDKSGLERERALISDYQEVKLRPLLEQLYGVVYAAQDGPTGGVTPDEWEVTFTPLNAPTEQELANLRKTTAETDSIYITAGVLSPEDVTLGRFGEDGWNLDLPPVKPIDPIEQAEIQAETMRIMAEASPDPEADPDAEPEEDDPRADAIDPDSVSILVPAADPGLRGAVASAIGQALTTESEPHVTILYLGRGHGQRKIAEIIRVVREEAARAETGTLMQGTIRSFPPGPDGTPIVVEFSDTWAVSSLHDRLLQRLAHLVRAKQHRTYRPHLTVGYARAPLSPEATTALLGVSAAEVRVGVSELRVQVGGQVVASVPVGG